MELWRKTLARTGSRENSEKQQKYLFLLFFCINMPLKVWNLLYIYGFHAQENQWAACWRAQINIYWRLDPFLAVFRRFGLVKTTKSNKTKTFLLVDQPSHIAAYFEDLNKRNNFWFKLFSIKPIFNPLGRKTLPISREND